MIPYDDQNKDSRLKTYMQETKKYKNSMKNNLRNLIYKNITNSSVSNEKHLDNLNNDSSISG
jgi:hypothetical protein